MMNTFYVFISTVNIYVIIRINFRSFICLAMYEYIYVEKIDYFERKKIKFIVDK